MRSYTPPSCLSRPSRTGRAVPTSDRRVLRPAVRHPQPPARAEAGSPNTHLSGCPKSHLNFPGNTACLRSPLAVPDDTETTSKAAPVVSETPYTDLLPSRCAARRRSEASTNSPTARTQVRRPVRRLARSHRASPRCETGQSPPIPRFLRRDVSPTNTKPPRQNARCQPRRGVVHPLSICSDPHPATSGSSSEPDTRSPVFFLRRATLCRADPAPAQTPAYTGWPYKNALPPGHYAPIPLPRATNLSPVSTSEDPPSAARRTRNALSALLRASPYRKSDIAGGTDAGCEAVRESVSTAAENKKSRNLREYF